MSNRAILIVDFIFGRGFYYDYDYHDSLYWIMRTLLYSKCHCIKHMRTWGNDI